MNKYDVGIIGAGVAGAFAALRISQNNPGTKTIIFDFGRPPGKRRRQLEGWFGCFLREMERSILMIWKKF